MLTNIAGIRVGHMTHREAATGCTVILCPPGTKASGEVRGGWAAVREECILSPLNSSPHINAVLLTGGSTFGLAAADGVVRWIEEHEGHDGIRDFVPQVPAAVIYDLRVGSATTRPTPADGYAACEAATGGPYAVGSVGAGTGATVGKWYDRQGVMKGGLGTSSLRLSGGVVVAALAVVNALGDVYDRDGTLLAGVRRVLPAAPSFVEFYSRHPEYPVRRDATTGTTLVVVATNARLSKTDLAILSRFAHSGLPRAINPVYMANDGDTLFALSTNVEEASVQALGPLAAEVVAEAIHHAVREATSLAGIPAARDLG
ncbi:MAG TPA: P1 family peptidase [bacterium]|nr:P1 family peptidase [bacterium]